MSFLGDLELLLGHMLPWYCHCAVPAGFTFYKVPFLCFHTESVERDGKVCDDCGLLKTVQSVHHGEEGWGVGILCNSF